MSNSLNYIDWIDFLFVEDVYMQGKNAVVKVLIYVEENRGIQNKNSLNTNIAKLQN